MSEPAAAHALAAAFHLLPAFVWAVIAHTCWRWYRHEEPPRSLLSRLFVLQSGCVAVHYGLHVVLELTPTQLAGTAPDLHRVLTVAINVSRVGVMAALLPIVSLLAIREEPLAPRWLAANFAVAGLVALWATAPLFVAPDGRPALDVATRASVGVYEGAIFVLAALRVRRLVREGSWPRAYVVGIRAALVVSLALFLLATAFGLGGLALAPVFAGGDVPPADIPLVVHTALGLAGAGPYAAMMLGRLVSAVVVTTAGLAASLALYVGGLALVSRLAGAEARTLVHLGVLGGLVLVWGPLRTWFGAAVERVLFRHGRRCREELQKCLGALRPELGVRDCARRALADVVRVMEARGAGLVLRTGPAVEAGAFSVGGIERAWPRGAAAEALPHRAFGLYDFHDPVLRAALAAADVGLVVPIRSPRAPWGHLFVAEGMLGHLTQHEQHVETLEAFGTQLALVLDGADLLARAVAVERSLAHAEKLAAVGETSARIVHDIRNPVAAARSLAQQLARAPAAPEDAEPAAIILEELGRVERRVAALLRFSRPDDFRFEPVDVGEVVRSAAEGLRARLEAAGLSLEVDAAAGIVGRADGEKLRQAVINLVENALEALAERPGHGRVSVAVTGRNGGAVVRVSDDGPGVPAESLARLFEPFFSLKPNGTGLGLAIVRRTIEAHGGRIDAVGAPGAGLSVRIELPLSS